MNIKPFNIWQNGQNVEAVKIDFYSIFDDLKTMAKFNFCLYSIDNNKIIDGIITIDGENYQNWDGSNTGAKKAVAEILNIQFL